MGLMGEVRQFWRCPFDLFEKCFFTSCAWLMCRILSFSGVFTAHILNVYLPILAICVCNFLDGEAITLQFVFSLPFHFFSDREIVYRGSNNKQSPIDLDEVQCTQLMWLKFL